VNAPLKRFGYDPLFQSAVDYLCWRGPTNDQIYQHAWAEYRLEVMTAVLDKTYGNCAYCGDDVMNTVNIDHIVSRRDGGSDHIENLAASCRKCNSSKGGSTIEQWRYFKRSKLSEALDGTPKFTRTQIEWLYGNGFNVLDGVPEHLFWFEKEELCGFEGLCADPDGKGEPISQERLEKSLVGLIWDRMLCFEAECANIASTLGVSVDRAKQTVEARAFASGRYSGSPMWWDGMAEQALEAAQ